MTYAWNEKDDYGPVTKIEQPDDDEDFSPLRPRRPLRAENDGEEELSRQETTLKESVAVIAPSPSTKRSNAQEVSQSKDPPPTSPKSAPSDRYKQRRIVLAPTQSAESHHPDSRRSGAIQVVVSPGSPPSPAPSQESPTNVKNRRCSFSRASPIVAVTNRDVIPKRRRIEGPLLLSTHTSFSTNCDSHADRRPLDNSLYGRRENGRGPAKLFRFDGSRTAYPSRRTHQSMRGYYERKATHHNQVKFGPDQSFSQKEASTFHERERKGRDEGATTLRFSSSRGSHSQVHPEDIPTKDSGLNNTSNIRSGGMKATRQRPSPDADGENHTSSAQKPSGDVNASAEGLTSRSAILPQASINASGRRDRTPKKAPNEIAASMSRTPLHVTPTGGDIEARFKLLEDAVLRKHKPLGIDALIFPEISGTTAISVNVTHVGKGVGKVMVMFEDLCLKILHYRMGWTLEDCTARIPEIRAVKRRPNCLPFFLRTNIDSDTANADKDSLLQAFITTVDTRLRIKSEEKEEPVECKSTKRKSTSREVLTPASQNPNALVELYSTGMLSHYLDPAKVMEGHPQRYESFNKRFDFITRSLLWCLRPSYFDTIAVGTATPSRQTLGKPSSASRLPWERSVELNADVMNVWMSLMQEWCDKLYEERLRRWEAATVQSSPSVVLSPGQSSAMDSSCHVLISSASTDVSCKDSSNPPRPSHDLLSGYPLSSDEEDASTSVEVPGIKQELQVKVEEAISRDDCFMGEPHDSKSDLLVNAQTKKEEILEDHFGDSPTPCKEASSPRERPKRSLFLSTDFMTTFENFLAPSPSSLNIKEVDSMTLLSPKDSSTNEVTGSSGTSSAQTKGNSGLEEGELSQEFRQVFLKGGTSVSTQTGLSRAQSHKKRLLSALMQVTPVNSFTAACERVFRFFERRRWNPWDFDYICWPINYLTAHWVLLTVDIGRRELVWSDSYRKWYVEVVEKRADANKLDESKSQPPPPPSTSEVPTTEVPIPTRKASKVPYDLSLASSPSSMAKDSDEMSQSTKEFFEGVFGREPPSAESSRSGSTSALADASNSVRLRYAGWIHFLCVEEYLKYDFKRRKEKGGVDVLKYADIDKAFDEGVPWKRVVIEHLPQQAKLSLDCGVYSAHFARCVGQFACTDEIDFDTDHIDAFRAIMAVLIGRGSIPDSPSELLNERPVSL